MKTKVDQLIEDYLRQLRSEIRDLARDRQSELIEEIRVHITEARGDLEPETEAGILMILDQIGDPAEIAAEARRRLGTRTRRLRGMELAALILLLIGGFIVPVVGWFAGVVLLWGSSAWDRREKLIGTLLPPLGLAAPYFLALLRGGPGIVLGHSWTCTEWMRADGLERVCEGGSGGVRQILSWGVLVGLALLAIGTTVYLARRARSRPPALTE